MSYYMGTAEGRSRLLVLIWLLSMIMTVAGFVIMAWIFYHGSF